MNAARLTWDDLFLNGSVVDLDVKLWTARTQLKPADLGIKATPEVIKTLSLGLYRLAPKEVFDELRGIAAEARKLVDYNSLTFAFIRGARYTPEKNLAATLDGLKTLQVRFDQAADYLADNINAIRDRQIPDLEKAIMDATRDPATVDNAVRRILAEYPNGQEVRRRCSLTWTVYAICGSSSPAAQEQAAQESESVKGIIRGFVEQLRGELSDRIGAIAAILLRSGKLPADTIRTTREILARVESMNVFQDSELSRLVRQTAALVDKAEAYSGKLTNGGLANELIGVQAELERNLEAAVQEAEANVTAIGRRKIQAAPAEEV